MTTPLTNKILQKVNEEVDKDFAVYLLDRVVEHHCNKGGYDCDCSYCRVKDELSVECSPHKLWERWKRNWWPDADDQMKWDDPYWTSYKDQQICDERYAVKNEFRPRLEEAKTNVLYA